MSEQAGSVRPNPCGSKACRRLFGPVDSEQLSRDCDALMAGCIQEARERWNFDFVTETPLEGDFAWERVRGLGLPKLYLPTGPRRGRMSWEEAGGLAPRPFCCRGQQRKTMWTCRYLVPLCLAQGSSLKSPQVDLETLRVENGGRPA